MQTREPAMTDHHGPDVSRSIRSDTAARSPTPAPAWAAPMAMSSNPPPVQAGDTVRLAGGGAVMSVERVIYDVERPFARCAWMDARDVLHRAFVNIDALERVEADAPASRSE